MKKNIASALLLGVIITTGSVFAQTDNTIVPITTENEGLETTSAPAPIREARLEEQREALRERAESQKETMEAKREALKQEAEARRAEARANLEARKAEFEKRKEEFKAGAEAKKEQLAARMEEAKAAREARKAEAEAIRKESAEKRKEFVQKGLLEVISVLESRATRLESTIATAASRGIPTTEATALVAEARTHITDAKNALETLKTTTVLTENGKEMTSARANAQAVHTHIKAAREALVKSAQALKTAITNAQQTTTNTTNE